MSGPGAISLAARPLGASPTLLVSVLGTIAPALVCRGWLCTVSTPPVVATPGASLCGFEFSSNNLLEGSPVTLGGAPAGPTDGAGIGDCPGRFAIKSRVTVTASFCAEGS